MLHVLLMILKIIGIILLVIIGLILLMILLVLFVPVRYRGDTKFRRLDDQEPEAKDDPGDATMSRSQKLAALGQKNEFYAMGKITWLLHFISIVFNYTDGIGYRVRVLGFTLMSGGNLEKKKKDKKKKGKKEQDASNEDIEAGTEETGESGDGGEAGSESKPEEGKKEEGKKEEGKIEEPKADEGKKDESKKEEAKAEEGKKEETKPGEDKKEEAAKEDSKPETDKKEEGKKEQGKKKDKSEASKDKKKKKKGKKDSEAGDDNSKKQSVVEKIKNIYNKITDILDDVKIQKAWELVKVQLVKLLKAVFPKKVSGYAKYGFEDPAITGYISAFLATQYGRLKALDIEPHFEDSILDGQLKFKGRIFMFTIVRIGLKVYFNKNVKHTIKKLKSLKSEE